MGQGEIFDLLKNKRLSGIHTYFNQEQIRKMLKETGFLCRRQSVNNSLGRLRLFGYLDEKIFAKRYSKTKTVYNAYRLKRKFC